MIELRETQVHLVVHFAEGFDQVARLQRAARFQVLDSQALGVALAQAGKRRNHPYQPHHQQRKQRIAGAQTAQGAWLGVGKVSTYGCSNQK